VREKLVDQVEIPSIMTLLVDEVVLLCSVQNGQDCIPYRLEARLSHKDSE